MKPGTLCVIEPTAADIARWPYLEPIVGLVVTTKEKADGGCWRVLPTPVVRADRLFIGRSTFIDFGELCDVLPHESWLRPLNGPHAEEQKAEPIDVTEVAYG